MKFDGGKQMFSTDLEEGMRDQSKFLSTNLLKEQFLEEICVVIFPYYDIND
jgi:hypothetical protein